MSDLEQPGRKAPAPDLEGMHHTDGNEGFLDKKKNILIEIICKGGITYVEF